ncbi:MAG: aminotransferase class V-fold PLP-dependent enzyme [Chloroflexales bacterium]|nr:aminotransferase class V-fold PLP-dependent enzyme [Chloroflexales bacterium]
MHPETLAIHADHAPDAATGAVVPPIHLSTTFVREPDGSYASGYSYGRSANPNRAGLEQCLAALEGGAAAAAFASGSAATLAILQSLAPGDHVIAPADVYYGTTRLLREVMAPWGLEHSLVDMANPSAVRAALRPNTRLVWLETPSNPLLTLSDIAALAALAHEVGALCAVDNTWATPIAQRPLDLGADLVMHSTTKYLGGHSDMLGGAVVARQDGGIFERIRNVQVLGGAVPSPFDCWLLLRGMRTLGVRMRAHSENALAVARFLEQHPAIECVHYPGLEQHPAHALARSQMRLMGGMVSVQLRGGERAARAMASATRLFTQATSLGGVESLIEHRASIEGPHSATPANLLRISVGLEHPDDLVDDLRQALEGIV